MTEGNHCGTSRPARLSPRQDETPTHDCLTLNVSRAYEVRLKSLGKIQRVPLGNIGRAATKQQALLAIALVKIIAAPLAVQ